MTRTIQQAFILRSRRAHDLSALCVHLYRALHSKLYPDSRPPPCPRPRRMPPHPQDAPAPEPLRRKTPAHEHQNAARHLNSPSALNAGG